MTDKEQRKLKGQLRTLRKLGLPADKSILSLIQQASLLSKKNSKLLSNIKLQV